jgi:hypothetical protein
MRSVKLSALCVQLAGEFNARVPDAQYYLKYSDGIVLELLPDVTRVLHKNENSPFRDMSSRALFWHVERQIKYKFEKLVSNSGAIIDITARTSKRVKMDRTIATSFSHFTWVHSNGRLMVLDIQGANGHFTDPEIVTKENSNEEFGFGNVGQESMETFFEEHECNLVCHMLGIDKQRGDNLTSVRRQHKSVADSDAVIEFEEKECGLDKNLNGTEKTVNSEQDTEFRDLNENADVPDASVKVSNDHDSGQKKRKRNVPQEPDRRQLTAIVIIVCDRWCARIIASRSVSRADAVEADVILQ